MSKICGKRKERPLCIVTESVSKKQKIDNRPKTPEVIRRRVNKLSYLFAKHNRVMIISKEKTKLKKDEYIFEILLALDENKKDVIGYKGDHLCLYGDAVNNIYDVPKCGYFTIKEVCDKIEKHSRKDNEKNMGHAKILFLKRCPFHKSPYKNNEVYMLSWANGW